MNFAFHLMGTKVENGDFRGSSNTSSTARAPFFATPQGYRARVDSLRDHGTRYEHECYDIGHLYNLAYFLDRGSVKPPLFIQSVFGILVYRCRRR